MIKEINIKLSKDTRKVDIQDGFIGNDAENLQGKLVFSFSDEFVRGQAKLEYKIGDQTDYIMLDRVNETYVTDIKNILTKNGQIDMQVVITEGVDQKSIPIYKSNVFYLYVGESLNVVVEKPEDYPDWMQRANTLLNQVENLDIKASKAGKKATIKVTRRDQTSDTVDIYDGATYKPNVDAEGNITFTNDMALPNPPSQNIKGPKGDKGDTYTLTREDKQEIANIATTSSESDFNKYYEGKVDAFATYADKRTKGYTENADTKLKAYNDNAASKTSAYNSNASSAVESYNNNAKAKMDAYNKNDTAKTTAYNSNAEEKVKAYNTNDTNKTSAYNSNASTKVNEYNTNAQAKLDDFNANAATYNERINQNTAAIRNNTGNIQNIQKTLFDSGLAKGEYVEIKDGALAEQKEVTMEVAVPQETTKGYQLLDIISFDNGSQEIELNGIKAVINKDKSIYVKGTATDAALITLRVKSYDLGAGDYTVAVNNPEIKQRLETMIRVDGNNKYIYANSKIKAQKEFLIISSYFSIAKGQSVDNTYKPIIAKGTEYAPFEEYTGGIPAPNPNYPRKINKIGGSVGYNSCSVNIVNEDEFIRQINLTSTATKVKYKGKKAVKFEYRAIKNSFNVKAKPKTKYTIEFNLATINSDYYLYAVYEDGRQIIINAENLEDYKHFKYTTDGNRNFKGLYLAVYKYSVELYVNELSIKEGTSSSKYEPYTGTTTHIDLKGNEVLPYDKLRLAYVIPERLPHALLDKASYAHTVNPSNMTLDIGATQEYQKLSYIRFSKRTDDINYGEYTQVIPVICNKATKGNEGTYDIEENINKLVTRSLYDYWLGVPKGTTLEQAKEQLADLQIVYKLADQYQKTIDLGVLKEMPLNFYGLTNCWTDKENVMLTIGYYRDFEKTIQNLEVDNGKLQAQLQSLTAKDADLEKRLAALETKAASEIVEPQEVVA